MAARPWQQAVMIAVARWQRPLVMVRAGEEALRVRHGAATVVVVATRHEKAQRHGGHGDSHGAEHRWP
jgi:predicted Zn-dependent protease